MKMNNFTQLKWSGLALLLLLYYSPLTANMLPEDRNLTEVLTEISERYQVIITYDAAMLKDIKVDIDENALTGNFEQDFALILDQTNLDYKYLGTKYYVIFKDTKEGKRTMRKLKRKIDQIQTIESSGTISLGRTQSHSRRNAVAMLQSLEYMVKGIDITGQVTDEEGNPLIGVNIQVKETNIGTSTDINGDYNLQNVEADAILIFSYVGYQKLEIVVDGRMAIDVRMFSDAQLLDELVVVGYGSVKKSDLTGAVATIKGEELKSKSLTQFTEMLTGTIAGFNSNQGTSAQGGASMEIRGRTSISGGTNPLIVLDGVIFNGSLKDINPFDIETINVMKDASSAAVFGAKAASGVVFVTTTTGKSGKPTINFSSKFGIAENYNERRGLGPKEFIQFRQDAMRVIYPEEPSNYYTNPYELPPSISREEWHALNNKALDDYTKEWLSRIRFFPVEEKNYLAGKTMDMYNEVFRKGFRQNYDLSLSGGTEKASYYWSIGYNDNEGIRVGDQYSSVRSRINANYSVADWLDVGFNAQFSDRDESSVPASLNFYVNSPFGEMFDDKGNLSNKPHGHSVNPLLDYYRTSLLIKTNTLSSNLYADIKLPWGFNFKTSFQPYYSSYKNLRFITISQKLGGLSTETPSGTRSESSTYNWMIDNILTWNKSIGQHTFDLTLLSNIEENRYWSNVMDNKNFLPNQQLEYHGLNFGDSPQISVNDTRSTGDAIMARVNYSLMNRYLLTASVRRDGYSAFGIENPRAVFPAFAFGWVLSEEKFFTSEIIDWWKFRISWGVNGNRDIGIYSALAITGSSLWFDGTNTRVGVYNSTLANNSLRWERTSAINIGIDIKLFENRISLTADIYDMSTKDLLLNRVLPRITGFSNITSNLGELQNKGFEITMETWNIKQQKFSWKSNFVYSLNRNQIVSLWGDIGDYELLGEEKHGEIPDLTNKWFPGQALDVVWDYDVTGIWQVNEANQAARYNLTPGDFKVDDVDDDGRYYELVDKKFIGYTVPRHRLGLRNDFDFLKNFTASIFIRADLGHISSYSPALNAGNGENDRRNRNNGPVPYWTPDNPNNEYAKLNPFLSPFGGGIMIYKPRSFLRIQDVTMGYRLPKHLIQRMSMNNLQISVSIRNLTTFTKWPGWDPESGMNPMPRTFTIGLNTSL